MLMRLMPFTLKKTDVELLVACAKGDLKNKSIAINPAYAVTVMMVAGGYPGEYAKGHVIEGLASAGNALIFHAGTSPSSGKVVTNGGRVLAVTGKGESIDAGRKNAYEAISGISWDNVYFRRDIGLDLLDNEGAK